MKGPYRCLRGGWQAQSSSLCRRGDGQPHTPVAASLQKGGHARILCYDIGEWGESFRGLIAWPA